MFRLIRKRSVEVLESQTDMKGKGRRRNSGLCTELHKLNFVQHIKKQSIDCH